MTYLQALRNLLEGLSEENEYLIVDACEHFLYLLNDESLAIPVSTRLLARSLLNSTPEREFTYWWTQPEEVPHDRD